jgi:hypothetical protein
MRDARFWMLDTGYRLFCSGFKVQSCLVGVVECWSGSGYSMQDIGFKVQRSEFRVFDWSNGVVVDSGHWMLDAG